MKKSKIVNTISLFICLIALLNGCVVHYPITTDVSELNERKYNFHHTLYYKTHESNFFIESGGPDKIDEVFKCQNYFDNVEKVYDITIPQKGYYVLIIPKWRQPSLPAMAFGYLSAITFTILPAWSTKDGYDLYFELYRDDIKVKTFDYRIKRVGGVWIALLPFVWVNFLTNSEEDAFEAATYQFFRDVESSIDLWQANTPN